MAKTYTPEEAEALVHSHDPEHVGHAPRFSSDAKGWQRTARQLDRWLMPRVL